MKKKIIWGVGILLCIMLLAILCPNKVEAAITYNDEISYEENYDGTIKVRAAGEYIESATIPSSINGKPVTEIDYAGFQNCKYLKTVTLPSTIQEIGTYAFEGCTSLTSINIPSQVKTMPYWGFQNCSSLKSINLSSVTKIEPYAFNGCSSLTSVTFSSNLQSIGDGAFKDTTALKTVNLPSKLTYLGDSTFQASGLTSITIPTSVTEMPSNYGAFEDCKSLKTATINASAQELPGNLFKNCTALTTVKFSTNSPITKFSGGTFEGCTSLTSVTLPSKLTNIGRGCFKDCTSLKSITIPDTVESIDRYAFDGCTGITTIKLPYNVKEIGPYAFSACSNLKSIYFTKAIQEIDDWAFYGDTTSKSIRFYGYSGTAAKYFAQENGYTFIECTPVSSIKITGNSSVLKKSSITLKATVSPSGAYNKTVKWSSSNSSIATVSSAGVVTGKAGGTATITAMATDGTGVKGTYTITVKMTELPFRDVDVDDWFYNVVKYNYQKELITGTTDTTFSPNDKLSRSMLATIIWRMEGAKKVSSGKSFPDVKEGIWYTNAIKWITSQKIMSGYDNGKFGPNDSITREQLAVTLRNYANYKKKNTNSTTSLNKYKYSTKVSSWAKTAMQWAVGKKIVSGKDNGTMLDPKGTATRAEAAAMINNYLVNVK